MTIKPVLLSFAAAVLLSSVAEQASAQLFLNRVQPPQARSNVSAPRAPSSRYFDRRPISKPFKDIERRPTVSPYLNLVRDDNGGTANYQTLVRPQMEQIDFNRQQERQFNRLDQQFQNFRSESAYPQGGSAELRETGHTTRFMNRSHYYPN